MTARQYQAEPPPCPHCGGEYREQAENKRLRTALLHIQDVAEDASRGGQVVSHWWYRAQATKALGNAKDG